MEISIIINIVLAILSIVGVFLAYYFKVRKDIQTKAVEYIDGAEDLDAEGKEKFDTVVSQIMQLIPTVVKPFLKQELVEVLVQEAFDKIESYAQKQVNK